jgi:hypothetical protein
VWWPAGCCAESSGTRQNSAETQRPKRKKITDGSETAPEQRKRQQREKRGKAKNAR